MTNVILFISQIQSEFRELKHVSNHLKIPFELDIIENHIDIKDYFKQIKDNVNKFRLQSLDFLQGQVNPLIANKNKMKKELRKSKQVSRAIWQKIAAVKQQQRLQDTFKGMDNTRFAFKSKYHLHMYQLNRVIKNQLQIKENIKQTEARIRSHKINVHAISELDLFNKKIEITDKIYLFNKKEYLIYKENIHERINNFKKIFLNT